jgi:hypothetical protein
MSDNTFFAFVLAFLALVLPFFAYLFVFGRGHRQHPHGRGHRHRQRPQGHGQQQPCVYGPPQPNVEVRMPNIPLVSPMVHTCRTCGIYLRIAVTTLKLNILLSTINRFETELVRVRGLNLPDSVQTVEFLRDEIASLTRKRVALCNKLVALVQSL